MGWPISARQPIGTCHDLMEIRENPSGRRSTIVTSQLTVEHGIRSLAIP